MSESVALFEGGTPEGPGEALGAYRAAISRLGPGSALRFHVDPANLGLLSRAAREAPAAGAGPVEVVLRARDLAFDRTEVEAEGALAPALRRLVDGAPPGRAPALRLSNGRRYALPPPALDVSTNDLCGLRCVMCNNRAPRRDPLTMRAEHVRALLAEAAAWGVRRVALTGAGEPFRDPNMLAHVRYANGLGHLVTITTNGFPLSEAVAEELGAATASVSVSIHGARDETHDRIAGVPTAAEHAWRAVRRLVAARERGGGRGKSKLSAQVSAVVQQGNLGEIADLVRRARDEGCDGVNLQPVNVQHGAFRGDAIVRRDDLVAASRLLPGADRARELDALFDELAGLRREFGPFVHADEARLGLLRAYFRDSSKAALGVGCRVGDRFLAVDHRGRIKPCYRLPWSLGDARELPPRLVWNSRAYERVRRQVDACPLTCLNNCFFRGDRPGAGA
ncbi:MAG TPA: radical SAM protein [Polyangiaceae bacterium]|nr:radical SAM protein [Polyangiaceae bacterium]